MSDFSSSNPHTVPGSTSEGDDFAGRAEAHRLAADLSGEKQVAAPPRVAGAPPPVGNQMIAQLGVDLERLSSNGAVIKSRIEAISQSLPIFKATLGHEDLVFELSAQRDHPVHALLRRLAEELDSPRTATVESRTKTSDASWKVFESWIGGITK